MLIFLDSDGKSDWMTKLRLLLHETGFGYMWLTQGVGDEQHYLQTKTDGYESPGPDSWFVYE